MRAIGPDFVRIVSYRGLCDDPAVVLAPLTEFCDIPFDPVRLAGLAEKMDVETDARYRRELEPDEVDWLEGFFDSRRRRQWDLLETGFPDPL